MYNKMVASKEWDKLKNLLKDKRAVEIKERALNKEVISSFDLEYYKLASGRNFERGVD